MIRPATRKRMAKIMLTLIGILCVLGSIGFTYAAYDLLIVGPATWGWTHTTGIVERNSIRSTGVHSEDECHTIQIAYRYHALGEEFVGREIGWRVGHQFSTLAAAQEVSARYPASNEVDVFFDPKKPERAVLVRGRSLKVAMLTLAGAIAFWFASFHLIIGFDG